ncbi:MAG TPA: hypothetical protein VI172_16140 [Candidatus Dormibacteraeota bacterium]
MGLELGRERHDISRAAGDQPGYLDRLLTRRLDARPGFSGLQVVEERKRVQLDQLLRP